MEIAKSIYEKTHLLWKAPLRKDHFEIRYFRGYECPVLMDEVGKLRENVYKKMDASSGKMSDVDHFDQDKDYGYWQVIIWSEKENRIIGGMRVFFPDPQKKQDLEKISIEKLFASSVVFQFSDRFKKEYLPHAIDIGRLFIVEEFQKSSVLYLLYRSLGIFTKKNPSILHLMGRVTINPNINKKTHKAMLAFLHIHHASYQLVSPKVPLFDMNKYIKDCQEYSDFFFKKNDYKKEREKLIKKCVELGEELPVLMRIYLSFSENLFFFGCTSDPHLNNIEELGIMISLNDIYPHIRHRYQNMNTKEKMEKASPAQ